MPLKLLTDVYNPLLIMICTAIIEYVSPNTELMHNLHREKEHHLKQLQSPPEFCPWSQFWDQLINFLIFKTFKTFLVNLFLCNQNICSSVLEMQK